MHKTSDEFEFQLYLTSHFGVTCPWAVKKLCLHLFSAIFGWVIVKLAGNEDRRKSLSGFQFGRGRTFHYRIIRPWAFPLTFEWGKWYLHRFSVTMNSVFIKLTGNEDMHKISDGFEFRSYLTSHFGITCPWVVKKDVSIFSQPSLVGSLSNLQITRTGTKTWISSNLGRIGLFTLELFIFASIYSYNSCKTNFKQRRCLC